LDCGLVLRSGALLRRVGSAASQSRISDGDSRTHGLRSCISTFDVRNRESDSERAASAAQPGRRPRPTMPSRSRTVRRVGASPPRGAGRIPASPKGSHGRQPGPPARVTGPIVHPPSPDRATRPFRTSRRSSRSIIPRFSYGTWYKYRGLCGFPFADRGFLGYNYPLGIWGAGHAKPIAKGGVLRGWYPVTETGLFVRAGRAGRCAARRKLAELPVHRGPALFLRRARSRTRRRATAAAPPEKGNPRHRSKEIQNA